MPRKLRYKTTGSCKDCGAVPVKTGYTRCNACFSRRANRLRKRDVRDKCRAITRNAIRSGKLIKLDCYVCGNPNSESHHPDYTKPFNVVWLCKDCHVYEHRMLRIGLSSLVIKEQSKY